MPALNNIRVETVCEKNRHLLEGFESHELINRAGFIDLNSLELQQQEKIIKEIIENEESNVIASEENYKKLKYKAKNTNELLLLVLALIVAGITLAPLFIASITLPVLPILSFGVVIIAITKLVLNRRIYQLGTNVKTAKKIVKQVKTLNQLTESNEGDENDEEISHDFNEQIREEESTIIAKNKIDEPTSNLSELLFHQGTFPIEPGHEDPANVYNRENFPSHSYKKDHFCKIRRWSF